MPSKSSAGYGEIADLDDVLRSHAFRLAGHDVRLEFLELSDQCRILVDLGEPANANDESIYVAMLESNFDNAEDALPVISLHPETRHVFLALHIPVCSLIHDVDLYEVLADRIQPVIDFWTTWLNEGDSASPPHAGSSPFLPFA